VCVRVVTRVRVCVIGLVCACDLVCTGRRVYATFGVIRPGVQMFATLCTCCMWHVACA
jgi:hypothetical protein